MEGVLPAQAIATLRGIPLKIAEAELREAGIVVAEPSVPWATPADLPDVTVDMVALDAALTPPDDEVHAASEYHTA